MINSTYACAVISVVQDPIVAVRRVMFFNACSVFNFSFFLSAWLCGIMQHNGLASGNHIKVATVAQWIQMFNTIVTLLINLNNVGRVMHLKITFSYEIFI